MLPEFYTTQAFGTQRRLCWRMRNDYFTLNITSSFLYHHVALLMGHFPKFLTPHWLHLFSPVIYLVASPFSSNNETGGKDEFFPTQRLRQRRRLEPLWHSPVALGPPGSFLVSVNIPRPLPCVCSFQGSLWHGASHSRAVFAPLTDIYCVHLKSCMFCLRLRCY